ncbi:heat shock 70 kDa protein 12A [Lingula anatina]|uniref:Heat shock 70 kDa protein 12A n=1 Tax=Lingula anatina TaxID=7574 RepID=A0A1S3IVL6_LINAN|nr:heat shock 70 kDa protein 12A [Lingula anatina]|eukprot:XP_013402235.1 heat shock 70 kDa protein 12A [Lingula anatina]
MAHQSQGHEKIPAESQGSQNTAAKELVVVAIDFGTSFSGYAYSYTHEPSRIYMNKNWGNEVGCALYKTPTCLLLRPDGTLDSFGFEATEKYAEMEEEDCHKEWFYFDRFKLKLHTEVRLDRNIKLVAANGRTKSAMEVFSLAIRHLREHFFARQHNSVSDHDVRWVITVPSIWRDSAKQFMREAAKKAGIRVSSRLVICYEPEAASVFCQRLSPHAFVGNFTAEGTRYLVLDCGGGTVDVTIQQILDNGHLATLHKASGGTWGGITVDRKFEQLLKDICEDEFIEDYKVRHPSDWVGLIRDFELKKRTVKGDSPTMINIRIPNSLREEFQFAREMPMRDACAKCNLGIQWAADKMRLPLLLVTEFFQDSITSIINHVKTLFEEPEHTDIQYIVLVGGFSESPLLQQAVKDAFRDGHQVVIPPEEAGLAIVKGAVLYGHNPTVIQRRVSSMTYGIECVADFTDGVHPDEFKINIAGRDKCKNVFKTFVEAGSSVQIGENVTHRFKAVVPFKHTMQLPVYVSSSKDAKYTTDPDTTPLGKISVSVPGQNDPGKERLVEVRMGFGDTEIHVTAVDLTTGNASLPVNINFLAK